MSGLDKIGMVAFAEEGTPPPLPELIPVFHRWIQTAALDDLLIDVADYSHVVEGPGIVLVGHAANYSAGRRNGRFAVSVYRKRPSDLAPADRWIELARQTLAVCVLLEGVPELGGRLRFRGQELSVFANDRLLAPNTPETLAALRPSIEDFAARLYAGAGVTLHPDGDPKERFSVTLRSSVPVGVEQLLGRLTPASGGIRQGEAS